jgi:hypothetical protein
MAELKRKATHTPAAQGRTTLSKGPEKRQRTSRGRGDQNYQSHSETKQWEDDDLLFDESVDYWTSGVQPGKTTLTLEDSDLFDDFPDEDLVHLSGSTSVQPFELPPSSVVRNHDRSSRSAEDYDSKLQYSPVTGGTRAPTTTSDQQVPEADVDWEPVRKHSHQFSSPMTLRSTGGTQPTSSSPCTSSAADNTVAAELPPYVLLKPFKTFLHIKDLVDTKAQMFSNSDTAHFELFTRVLYSSRENFTHKQFFQFRDLLKETPPYLNGTLRDWRALPFAEQALAEFIKKQRAGTKCYCLCTLIPDRRSALGWSAVIKDIRPISWKEIRLVVDRLGLTDLDHSPTFQRA